MPYESEWKLNLQRIRFAFRAFGLHLAISVAIALLGAMLVFVLWFPEPYAAMVGGLELFEILLAVDIACGPLLTLVVFTPAKSHKELMLDLTLIAVLQLCAFGYGVQTMWHARPVYLAYEVDRFFVITHANIHPDDWAVAPSDVPRPGWTGPRMLAVHVAQPSDADYLAQVQISLNGLDAAYRPDRWMPYEQAASQLKARAQPLEALYKLHPNAGLLIDRGVHKTGRPNGQLRWLPVQTKKGADWIGLIDIENLNVLGYLPLNGFQDGLLENGSVYLGDG